MTRHQGKARRSKPEKPDANVDEKPTSAPDQNPVSRLKALGGGDCGQWNNRITGLLFMAMPGINMENARHQFN
jgi:hypothetical protein